MNVRPLTVSEVLSKCGNLIERVARLEKNRIGVHKADEEEGEILQKGMRFAKGTAANDPPEPWIDGVRDLIDRLHNAGVLRAEQDIRPALLKDPGFLALWRAKEKNPDFQNLFIESVRRAELVGGGTEDIQPPAGPYDVSAFNENKEQNRRRQLGREARAMPAAVKLFVANIQAIADDLRAGGKGVSASDVAKMTESTRQDKGPMVDFGLQKSATDTTRVDVRSLGRPRRMQPGEILR